MSEVVVSPAKEDPFVRGLSEAIGGPRGEHAVTETPSRGGRLWTAARIVLALTCLTLALHWVQKSPCRDGAWVDLKQYTNFCYTDVLALYYAEGLNQGKIPYVPEKPSPMTIRWSTRSSPARSWVCSGLPVHAIGEKDPELNQGQAFYDLNALCLSALRGRHGRHDPVVATAKAMGRRDVRPLPRVAGHRHGELGLPRHRARRRRRCGRGPKRKPWLAGVLLGLGDVGQTLAAVPARPHPDRVRCGGRDYMPADQDRRRGPADLGRDQRAGHVPELAGLVQVHGAEHRPGPSTGARSGTSGGTWTPSCFGGALPELLGRHPARSPIWRSCCSCSAAPAVSRAGPDGADAAARWPSSPSW